MFLWKKPFTYSVAQGEELVELAARKNLKIMVDHTFLFTGAVRKIKETGRQERAWRPLLL